MAGHDSVQSGASRVLSSLHYAGPAIIVSSFLATYILGSCYWPSTFRKVSFESKQVLAARWLSAFAVLTLVAQTVLFIHCGLRVSSCPVPDDAIMFVLLQLLTLGTPSLLLFTSRSLYWPSFLTGWTLTALLDIPILVLSFSTDTDLDDFHLAHQSLHASRALAFWILSLMWIPLVAFGNDTDVSDDSQPLLDPECTSNTNHYRSTYGTAVDADDSGDSQSEESYSKSGEDFFTKNKRVQRDGGWVKFLKEYRIFLPYIWPARNRKFQLYCLILVFNILAKRALNVLYPRQFGIVVDKLYQVAGGGPIPVRDILLWILFEILSSGSCGLPVLNEMLEFRISTRSRVQLGIAAFDHVMGLPMSFHDSKDSGEIIKAIEQAGSLASVLKTLILDTGPFLLDIIVACWYVTYLMGLYGTVVVIFVGITFSFATYYLSFAMENARRTWAAKARIQSKTVYEMVSNWATVSYFNRRIHEQNRLGMTINQAAEASKRDNDVSILMFGAQEICEILGRLVITILAAYRIAIRKMPPGNFIALESYWATITTPLWMLGHSYRQLARDLVDAERLLHLFKTKSTVQDKPFAPPIQIREGKIELSHVCFGYHESQTTLDDITFTAEPGQTIALVGETGSGKSTTMKLLMRFYDVDSGAIMIDSQDLRDVTLHSLREAFGFVPQNAALFNMSILENVKYGKLDATEDEVREACKAAAIHDKILTFPGGYDAKVGERGIKLSGGELQRIAIARVILKNPQVVLLDEATSALDTNTEASIQSALRNLAAGRTTIVIAHRLSTITSADLILVLHNGVIVERGTHAELLGLGGRYADFWTKQTQSQISR